MRRGGVVQSQSFRKRCVTDLFLEFFFFENNIKFSIEKHESAVEQPLNEVYQDFFLKKNT
jgi:hypothetical protein